MPDASPDKEAHSSQSPRMDVGFATYLVSYPYQGARWGVELKATSFEDAAARLRALGWGSVDGVAMFKVLVPGGNWLRRILDRGWRKPTESEGR
jgi:hypothetical protein